MFRRIFSATIIVMCASVITIAARAGQQERNEKTKAVSSQKADAKRKAKNAVKTTRKKRDKSEQKNRKDKESLLVEFMALKLKNSNKILEGLVTDDFDMIEQGATALLKMSDAEKWRAHNDMMYLQHSREFRSAVEMLQKKAKKKSIDGAGLAWMDVTMSCIRCHEWVRNIIVAGQ